jgi:hypothetical protein
VLLNEDSFIGVGDFEHDVGRDGFNHQEETLFDDEIMNSLLQLNNDQARPIPATQALTQKPPVHENDSQDSSFFNGSSFIIDPSKG